MVVEVWLKSSRANSGGNGCSFEPIGLAILKWAAANKMTINITKTKEIVFRRPNPKIDLHLPSLLGIEIVNEAKLLGVIFTNNFHFDSHINYLLKVVVSDPT
jgi:hypothetical protein